LTFTTTSFHKDASQTTIPFIDMQPMFAKEPVPLSGVSLYYKTSEGYGGFIGLKIYTNTQIASASVSRNLDKMFEQVDRIIESNRAITGKVISLSLLITSLFVLLIN
jgi:hypothetical protein